MTYYEINIGSAANVTSADGIRSAGSKINNNFKNLYGENASAYNVWATGSVAGGSTVGSSSHVGRWRSLTSAYIPNDIVAGSKLSDTGVTAQTYGGTAYLISLDIDSKGRITDAENHELLLENCWDVEITGSSLTDQSTLVYSQNQSKWVNSDRRKILSTSTVGSTPADYFEFIVGSNNSIYSEHHFLIKNVKPNTNDTELYVEFKNTGSSYPVSGSYSNYSNSYTAGSLISYTIGSFKMRVCPEGVHNNAGIYFGEVILYATNTNKTNTSMTNNITYMSGSGANRTGMGMGLFTNHLKTADKVKFIFATGCIKAASSITHIGVL